MFSKTSMRIGLSYKQAIFKKLSIQNLYSDILSLLIKCLILIKKSTVATFLSLSLVPKTVYADMQLLWMNVEKFCLRFE